MSIPRRQPVVRGSERRQYVTARHPRLPPRLGVFFLQTLNWHKIFPNSRIMARYYASDFDFSRPTWKPLAQPHSSCAVPRGKTAGLLDERFRWAMVDLAYEYMLRKKGYKLSHTPCAEVIHFGSQTVNQDVLRTLREQCQGFIDFSDAYDYFGNGWLTKLLVRCAVMVRYHSKVLEYHLSSDKRVIKGPGAPAKDVAAQAAVMRNSDPQNTAEGKCGEGTW